MLTKAQVEEAKILAGVDNPPITVFVKLTPEARALMSDELYSSMTDFTDRILPAASKNVFMDAVASIIDADLTDDGFAKISETMSERLLSFMEEVVSYLETTIGEGEGDAQEMSLGIFNSNCFSGIAWAINYRRGIDREFNAMKIADVKIPNATNDLDKMLFDMIRSALISTDGIPLVPRGL